MSAFDSYLLFPAGAGEALLLSLKATGLVLPVGDQWEAVLTAEQPLLVAHARLTLEYDYAEDHGFMLVLHSEGRRRAVLEAASEVGHEWTFEPARWSTLMDGSEAAALEAWLATEAWTHEAVRDRAAKLLGFVPEHGLARGDLKERPEELGERFPDARHVVAGRGERWPPVVDDIADALVILEEEERATPVVALAADRAEVLAVDAAGVVTRTRGDRIDRWSCPERVVAVARPSGGPSVVLTAAALHVWEGEAAELRAEVTRPTALAADAAHAYVGTARARLYIHALATGELAASHQLDGDAVTHLARVPRGAIVAVVLDWRRIVFLDVAAGEPVRAVVLPRSATALVAHPSGRSVIIADEAGEIRALNHGDGRVLRLASLTAPVRALAIDARGEHVLAVRVDGKATRLDVRARKEQRVAVIGRVTAAAWGDRAWLGHYDGRVAPLDGT